MTPRLPLRVRAAVTVLVVLAVLLVAGATAALQYGANALRTIDGDEQSTAGTQSSWVGFDLENPTAVPLTLRAVRAHVASNARIGDVRVLDATRSHGGIAVANPPLAAALQADVDAAAPVDGFVVPPGSRDRYQVIVHVERIDPSKAAVLRETDIVFSALGLDHGFRSHAVFCIRASGAQSCPAT